MKISVCIPFYNCSRYLIKAFDSIEKQTYKNWEIILLNDGSSKKEEKLMLDIVAQFNYKVKVINSKNKGLFSVRSSLFKEATGDIVMFLDPDDFYTNNSVFEKIVEEFNNKNIDCVIFNCTRNINMKNYLDYSQVQLCDGIINITSLREVFCNSDVYSSLCLKAFRRDIFDFSSFGVREKINMAEDRLRFAFCLDQLTSATLINESLYFYRENSSSVVNSTFDIKDFKSLFFVENNVKRFADKWNVEGYDFATYAFHYIIYYSLNKISMSKYKYKYKIKLFKKIRNNDYCISFDFDSILFKSKIEWVIGHLFYINRFRLVLVLLYIKNYIGRNLNHGK